jgi:hypothetical protein
MDFEKQFHQWLSECLSKPVPESVQAFSFNLFEYPETPECKFGIELVGASSFDDKGPDWACNEIWEPTARTLEIPKGYSGTGWQGCLFKARNLIINYLNAEPVGAVLKSRQGVGLGFVDGDLEIVWRP